MSVPGAENPDKVANIVKGKGALEGMRRLYGGYLKDSGVSWDGVDMEHESWEWRGNGEEYVKVSSYAIVLDVEGADGGLAI